MTERLSDARVAHWTTDRWGTQFGREIAALALEVQERRSQRCETCARWQADDPDDPGWCDVLRAATLPHWHCADWKPRV